MILHFAMDGSRWTVKFTSRLIETQIKRDYKCGLEKSFEKMLSVNYAVFHFVVDSVDLDHFFLRIRVEILRTIDRDVFK